MKLNDLMANYRRLKITESHLVINVAGKGEQATRFFLLDSKVNLHVKFVSCRFANESKSIVALFNVSFK